MNHRYILNVFKQQQKSILSDDFIVTLEKLCCLYWLKIYEAAFLKSGSKDWNFENLCLHYSAAPTSTLRFTVQNKDLLSSNL